LNFYYNGQLVNYNFTLIIVCFIHPRFLHLRLFSPVSLQHSDKPSTRFLQRLACTVPPARRNENDELEETEKEKAEEISDKYGGDSGGKSDSSFKEKEKEKESNRKRKSDAESEESETESESGDSRSRRKRKSSISKRRNRKYKSDESESDTESEEDRKL
jgi:hypothetical protein